MKRYEKTDELRQLQYQATLEARRGDNFTYLTDKVYVDLEIKGYALILEPTMSKVKAVNKAGELRATGHYARVFCESNKLNVRNFQVWAKKRAAK